MSGNAKALSKPISVGGRSWTIRIEDKPMRLLVCYPPEPENVAKLHHAGALVLRLWGLECLTDVATLLISELVTNAVLHGRGTISFTLTVQGAEVRLQVEDESLLRPCVASPDPERESGRGMWLVDHFSDRWGTSKDGTSTWCTLAVLCGAAGVEG
jgi:anti-sigma regulatory factor (Ser/Thr protein kinase)